MIKKTTFIEKPPVVTIMGHVDHGKTTLLDSIRQSKITKSEFGGITQHIGAYQITHNRRLITFIDTPGHAAFTRMRAQGVLATDIVVLVVAGNEGVKPQTKESIAHIKAAKVPFIVAITKSDLPDFNADMAKAQLAQENILVEGYGGQTVCINVSAKTGEGVDQLLEMILLMAQMSELKSDLSAPPQAVIIESQLDRRKGSVATAIVKKGMFRIGDTIAVNDKTAGKIRIIFNDLGQKLTQIKAGDAGQIMGFKSPPPVGAIMSIADEWQTAAREIKPYKNPYRKITKKEVEAAKEAGKDQKEDKIKIKLVVKADTRGTLEAIKSNLPDEIEIVFIEIGDVNESDVMLAKASAAQIVTFNVKTNPIIKKLASNEGVIIRPYNIIYQLLEDLEKRVLEWLEPTFWEVVHGEGKIIAVFTIHKEHIAGCRTTKGFLSKQSFFRIIREDKTIAENLKVKTFQKQKIPVEKVKAGEEVGIVFTANIDFKLDDAIISYSKNK